MSHSRRSIAPVLLTLCGALLGGMLVLAGLSLFGTRQGGRSPSEQKGNTRAQPHETPEHLPTHAATGTIPAPVVEASIVPAKETRIVLPTPDEQRARYGEMQRQRLAEHQRQQRDPAWAPKAEGAVKSGLVPLATRGRFTIEGIDCRSSSCVARLGWATFSDARSNFRTALLADIPLGCATAVHLPDPLDVTAHYSTEIVFEHCAVSGAGASSPAPMQALMR